MCKKIKTTITLAPHIKEFANKEAKSLGLDFSAYITVLIAEKMRGNALTIQNTSDSTKEMNTQESIDKKDDHIEIDVKQENEIDRLLQW